MVNQLRNFFNHIEEELKKFRRRLTKRRLSPPVILLSSLQGFEDLLLFTYSFLTCALALLVRRALRVRLAYQEGRCKGSFWKGFNAQSYLWISSALNHFKTDSRQIYQKSFNSSIITFSVTYFWRCFCRGCECFWDSLNIKTPPRLSRLPRQEGEVQNNLWFFAISYIYILTSQNLVLWLQASKTQWSLKSKN